MTKPRDPGQWDDTQLVRQLRRRIERTDVRTRDLVYELELRLWQRKFKIESMNESAATISEDIGRIDAYVREVEEMLGGRPRTRPVLKVAQGGNDA